MDILKCSCGRYINFDCNSHFFNGNYSGICEGCGKEHRAASKLVDSAIWNYKGDESEEDNNEEIKNRNKSPH